MIELSAVTKVFTLTKDQRKIVGSSDLRPKVFTAVDSVTFKCESGKVFALIGPNGSGKTTTLRMISTMMRPTSGSININVATSVQLKLSLELLIYLLYFFVLL